MTARKGAWMQKRNEGASGQGYGMPSDTPSLETEILAGQTNMDSDFCLTFEKVRIGGFCIGFYNVLKKSEF